MPPSLLNAEWFWHPLKADSMTVSFSTAPSFFGYRPRGDFLSANEVRKLVHEHVDIVSNPRECPFKSGLLVRHACRDTQQSCCAQE
jgi:hypothetical protein